MNNPVHHIISKSKRKWQAIIVAQWLLVTWIVSVVASILLFLTIHEVPYYFLFGGLTIIGVIIAVISIKSNVTDKNVLRLLNTQIAQAEDSAELLLTSSGQLNLIQKLQQAKVASVFEYIKPKLKIKHRLVQYGAILILTLAASWLVQNTDWGSTSKVQDAQLTDEIKTINGVEEETAEVIVERMEIMVTSPSYTRKKKIAQNTWPLNVVEGTSVQWKLIFSDSIKNAQLKFSDGKVIKLRQRGNIYSGEENVSKQGYYELNYMDANGIEYASEYYKIEVITDETPSIAIKPIKQYTEYEFGETDEIDFVAELNDDFGLNQADITATISKGSGESVKFRELKMPFDNTLRTNGKTATLKKHISFSALNMEPGDELYFYVEAWDNKKPKPNLARSETHFIVLRDTATYEFSLEGNLGVDLMPEYFRSQRQIIIDTEKLIANKSKLSEYDFNNTSNELGFDQKTLRLKYGQFMGEEDESGIAIQDDVEVLEQEEEVHEEGDEDEEENPLKGYMHDHDNENEHNLVEHAHEEELNEDGEVEEDPLDEFQHDHDAEEINTFLTNTIKGKLRAAMNLMWDAELYLRLFQPENSLPYQYKALKLIKEIKNHARIYVHRIGFDPPPIKEESRLSGDLDEVSTRSKYDDIEKDESLLAVRLALEVLNTDEALLKSNLNNVFTDCGREVAPFAIENPARYLSTLQVIKRLSEGEAVDNEIREQLKRDLFSLLPNAGEQVHKKQAARPKIEKLFYQNLEGQKLK